MVAEIDLEEQNELEMEVMRRQVSISYAMDPLTWWKQDHGILGQVGLNSNETTLFEVILASTTRGEVTLPFLSSQASSLQWFIFMIASALSLFLICRKGIG